MSDRDQPKAAQMAGTSLMTPVDAIDGAASSPFRLAESGGTADYPHSEAGDPGNPGLYIREEQDPTEFFGITPEDHIDPAEFMCNQFAEKYDNE